MKAFNKDKALRKLQFKQNRGKYIKYGSIVLSCLILVIGIIMFTFAKFESTSEWTLIEGTVTESSKDANIIAIYVDEVKTNTIPAKNGDKIFDRAVCDNGATATWDNNEWGINIRNMTGKTKCTLYFKTKPPYEIISGDLATVGSIIKIANEEFYVIGQEDSTHVKLLSKWNLNVGSNAKPTSALNLQDSDVRGFVDSGTPGYVEGMQKYGNVAFSSTYYWYDSTNRVLKSQYGSSYPAYVYDSNSNLKQYVDTYVTYLTNQGVNVSGRLIKQEELVSLGCNASTRYCDSSNGGTAPEWVYQTSYWPGLAEGSISLWGVLSLGGIITDSYDDDYISGVRPVIILEI